jgi:fatty-acyl-CoA synthase
MVPRHPGNVADVLRLAARTYGDREMVAFRDRRFTYREFNDRVNRLADGLRRSGVEQDDVVASVAYNSDGLLALYFALAKLGAVSVPLNTMLTRDDVEDLVHKSGARALVYGEEWDDRVQGIPGVELIAVSGDDPSSLQHLEAAGAPDEPPLIEGGARPATVIFTSGSTGSPKGCMKSHANMLWSAIHCQIETPRSQNDIELYVIPLAGVGFANFLMPAVLGGARVVLDRFDPARGLESIESERVSHVFLAGSMLDAMLRVEGQERFDLSSLRLIETAYQLSGRLRDAIAERFGPIVRWCYGSTEGTNWAAPAEAFSTRPDCVGFPKGIDEFRIVDDDGNPLPPGEVGEVLVAGPTVMLGYLADPEETAAVLHDGWLLTGDLGEIDTDGMMLFRGRKKDMIKTGGMNVAAGEVELALARHGEIAEVAVIGVADDKWGEAVTAVVVPADGRVPHDAFVEDLRAHCRATLAGFKRPKEYIVMDELPKNPTGKVAKGVLQELYGAGASAGRDAKPFMSESQKK